MPSPHPLSHNLAPALVASSMNNSSAKKKAGRPLKVELPIEQQKKFDDMLFEATEGAVSNASKKVKGLCDKSHLPKKDAKTLIDRFSKQKQTILDISHNTT